MSKEIRLRMAPSPTGFLHLGGLRTALFGYLLAKKWNGSFILRIEDTDQARLVPGATESLINIFKELGITFDEGPVQGGDYGPYIQTERLEIYKKYAEELVEKGEAYYCFAKPEELEALRNEQIANHEPPRYDRRYRDFPIEEAKNKIANHEPYVIRHKLPLDGEIDVYDELRGKITFKFSELDDYVLLKSDGLPTYQLASVVDDHLMKISHVTRGEEWIPSLPKNVLLYKSFGWELPKFIHLPLILNKTGGKLSKRQGDVYVEQYLSNGYLKEALINFCVLLGWHPKDDKEIFSLDELEKVFDIDGMGISPAIFDIDKLDSINAHYIRSTSEEQLLKISKNFLPIENAPQEKQTDKFLIGVLKLEKDRLKKLSDLKDSTAFFFEDKISYDKELLIWKSLSLSDVKSNLNKLLLLINDVSEGDWNKQKLEEIIIAKLKENNYQLGDYLWPMRVALSGRKASPGPFEIAEVLGKEETISRISFASSLAG